MLRRGAALAAVMLAAAASCGGMPHAATPTYPASIAGAGPPLPVSTSSEARRVIKDGRLTRTLLLDGGKLRLDPTSSVPRLSEDRAVRLWAAGGGAAAGLVDTEQAVVVLARVTLRVPVSTAGLALRPATLPTFTGRDAWVMLWRDGPHSCPALPVHPTGPGGLEPQPVEIIAADGSTDGVSYTTRGSFCEEPISGPTASPAVYQESLPWTVVSSTATSETISFTVPACGVQSGLADDFAGPSGGKATVWVGAAIVLGAGPCPGAKPGPATVTVARRAGSQPSHGATGPLVGRFSGDVKTLRYFDGQTKTLPVRR